MKAQNTGKSETRDTACRSILKIGLVALLAVAAWFGSPSAAEAQVAHPDCTIPANNCFYKTGQTNFTASTSQSLVFNAPTVVTNQTTSFQTELIGKITGGTPLYDRTFAFPFSDPVVQGGVTQARLAITTAGGPGVVILGPVLTSHTMTVSSSSVTNYSFNHAETSGAVTTTIGNDLAANAFVIDQHNGATTLNGVFIGTIAAPTQNGVLVAGDVLVEAVVNGQLIAGAPTPTYIAGVRSDCSAAIAALPSTTRPVCAVSGQPAYLPGAQPIYLTGGEVGININNETTDFIDQATTTTTDSLTSEVYTLTGTVKPFGTIHDAVADAGFAAGDRFARRLLGAGQGGGVEAFGTSDWRVWEEAYGYNATVGHQGDIPGYSNLTGGLRGGISYQADDSFQVGAGLDYNSGALGENTAQEFGNLHLVQFGLNAGWHRGDLFATLAGSYGSATASTQVTPQGISQTALSHYGFHLATVAGEGGMRFDLGNGFALTPSLGAAYYNIDQGGFTEAGSLLALTAAGHSFERNKEWLGLKGDTDINLDGTTLSLAVFGRAAFWGGDTSIALPVSFVGSTTMLSLAGTATGTMAGEAGASVGWKAFNAVSFFASYDADFQARTALQTLSVGLNIAL